MFWLINATPGRSVISEDLLGAALLWLPFLDAYRTFCIAPPAEVGYVFETIRDLGRAGYELAWR